MSDAKQAVEPVDTGSPTSEHERKRKSRRAKPAVEPITVGSKQAAEILGVSARTLWTLTDAGEIPCIRYAATGSKRVTKLYRIADLRAWAEAKAEEGRR